jgi:hypothetical protein
MMPKVGKWIILKKSPERNSSTDFGQQIQIGSADFVEKSKNERSANIGSHKDK